MLDGGSPKSGGAGFAGTGASKRFVIHDERFADVLGKLPTLEPVVEVEAHEGPVYSATEDALYFTTVPARDADGMPHVSIRRLDLGTLALTTVREDANVANGMFLDRDGSLVVCEQGTRRTRARISRLDPRTGGTETIVDGLGGFRLNSPNDVVVRSDGTIWFTDPSYGHLQGFRPRPELGDLLYRYDPRVDRLSIAADSFDKPNGLAFSPDEDVLYVADNGRPHHLVSFEVSRGGRLQRRRVLAAGTPGHPDGLKVDTEGRIYASSSDGIRVHDPSGLLLGEILLPGSPAGKASGAVNFTFGGPDSNVLFITADTTIWAATLDAKGASPWHSPEPAESSTTQARRLSPTPQPLMPTIAEAVSSSPW
jgi:gluconolactonase